jgi:hypothetical protein
MGGGLFVSFTLIANVLSSGAVLDEESKCKRAVNANGDVFSVPNYKY